MISDKLNIYFIMGTADVGDEDPLVVLEEALRCGITCFQFREKGKKSLQGKAYAAFAKNCQELCRRYHVPFIVNDDVDLAVALQADGLHIGQKDGDAATIRKKIGDKMILGVSTHSLQQLTTAIKAGADYVGIGPVYATQSKADAEQPVGIRLLHQAATAYPDFPKVAIGGLTPANSSAVVAAGVSGIAVISAISRSQNRQQTIQQFRNLF
ncbi:thiamine phosphate synthase [Vagococcus acidifermentans]|uniref:Thiamine-phosphate synthase n=1 Tax=Vagococcus acidifermentans TaxID=564710 RepID=A0A430AQS3_9ENTE|nr:thiamine phosphate synthase [Vagococcus acidifermentans]RSU10469.1 thiamine-phosphate diphosphorylase [Vagococcus acidifermentans]